MRASSKPSSWSRRSEAPMAKDGVWRPDDAQKKVLNIIMSMTTDCLLNRGTVDVETYVSNLKAYCGMLEKKG